MYRLLLLLIFILQSALLQAAGIENPVFWERSFTINISNPNSIGTLIQTTSYMATSQDFQGIYVDNNPRNAPDRIIFNFGESCPSSNTTMDTLRQINFNSIQAAAIQRAEKIALVKRGNCSWSEKVKTVNQLSTANTINISAVFIYDNDTHGNSIDIQRTAVTGSGSIAPPIYPDALPVARSVLNMTDNDLDPSSPSTTTVYFVPYIYGNQFVQRINQMYNASNPDMRQYWLLTPYLEEVSWGYSGGDGFFSTGRGYLSYIIALAAIFLIGVIVIRWWKIRRMRNELANGYNGYSGNNGFPMQPRNNQLDPLPVDIVNSMPIDKYSVDLIKNINCAICLEDFAPGKNDVRILPCGHGFCVLCIDPWLTQKSTMCPICKWDCLPVDLRREREQQQQQQQANVDNSAVAVDMTPGLSHTQEQPLEEANHSQHSTIIPPPILPASSPPSPPLNSKNPFIDRETSSSTPKNEETVENSITTPFSNTNEASSSTADLLEKKDPATKH